MKSKSRKKPRNKPASHHRHAGYTIPAAAEDLKMGEGVIRRAVDKGQIKTVEFAGLRRIPPAEIERIRQLLGIEAA